MSTSSRKDRHRDDSEFVLKEDCQKQHAKIDLALFGLDGRGGIVKDIAEIKAFMKDESEERSETKAVHKEVKKEYRSLAFAIIGGLVVAGLQTALLIALHVIP